MDDFPQSRHHITNSTAWLLLRLVTAIFLVETVYAVFIMLSLAPSFSVLHIEATIGLWVLHTVKFIALIAVALMVITPWASTQYYLTGRQLIKYTGLSRRDEEAVDLDLLKTVALHQGWLGRIFNYGDINLVFSSSGYHRELRLYGIYNPKKYERLLRGELDKVSGESS